MLKTQNRFATSTRTPKQFQKAISIGSALLLGVLFSACDGTLETVDAGPSDYSCSTLSFEQNIVISGEDALYDRLFDCYDEVDDAGIKVFGGVAYDVGFLDDGSAECVQVYQENILPRSRRDALESCHQNILLEATADSCPDCGIRGYGFLLCLNRFENDDCTAFIEAAEKP